MALSWNEIKSRAVEFSKEWERAQNEDADAKPFLDAFFDVFGVPRRRFAEFESKVKVSDDRTGYIDLLWKGNILVEFKSRGKDLIKAYNQAREYLRGLADSDLPKYILISDFQHFHLYDLDQNTKNEFELKDLYKNVKLFGFMAGYQKITFREEDPVNIRAAELMGKLHDELQAVGYSGHPLELYLVRLVFCLFADDTTIFEKDSFHAYLLNKTSPDGTDLASKLSEVFYILNTPVDKRLKNLDEELASFPYVNGKLFEETLPPASFDRKMRDILFECMRLDWGKISPAIFGSMFQSVMDPKERRNLGAHYTSEKNILKLIKPLFLDELWEEFNSVKINKGKLQEFHKKISNLRFLDPACGCGNFLLITYKELRMLELAVLKQLQGSQQVIDLSSLVLVNIEQFYGIEIEEFPAQIAQVAMWLMDHKMNMVFSEEFGEYFIRLPLKHSAKIVNGDALDIDWNIVVPSSSLSYIIGNPPFLGKSNQTPEQKKKMEAVFHDIKGAGVLDFVAAWYLKAAQMIQGTKIKVAYVSTNSICQGEQVGILWRSLICCYNVQLSFAYQTFKWNNDAKGNAAVHVVIIGFQFCPVKEKYIFEYNDLDEHQKKQVGNISPYLNEGPNIFLSKLKHPICNVPEMNYGSMPNDGGNLLLNENERSELVAKYPEAAKHIRRFVMGEELIHNVPRYCLWLINVSPAEINTYPFIKERVNAVKKVRESSTRASTNELSKFPTRFGEVRQPSGDYIALPRVSSENRDIIPITILDKSIIAGDKVYTISSNAKYLIGVLMSKMHMSWMKTTCGRMKSDFSYSNLIVYNNYPWPKNPTDKHMEKIERCAQAVLDARKQFPESSLSDLYHPLTMPPVLVKAHNDLDKAVDEAYRSQPFTSESERMSFLFDLYEKYTAGLFASESLNKLRKKKAAQN